MKNKRYANLIITVIFLQYDIPYYISNLLSPEGLI